MSKKLTLICFLVLASISKLLAQNEIDRTSVSTCSDTKNLVTNYNVSTKKFNIKLGDIVLLPEKSINDADIQKVITDSLKKKLDVNNCTDAVKIAEIQELIQKYPAFIESRLKTSTNSVTRKLKLNQDYTVEEIRMKDYTYSFALVNNDPAIMNSGKVFLQVSSDVKPADYIFSNLNDPAIQQNIASIIAFVEINKEVKIKDIYLVYSGKSNELWFDGEVKSNILSSTKKVPLKDAQLDSLKTTLTTYALKDAGSTYAVKQVNEIAKQESQTTEGASSSRVSFTVGVGAGLLLDHLYQMPVVDKSTNNVMIENAQRGTVDIAFGVLYTPYYYKITDRDHPEGQLIPKGITYGAFVNPVNLLRYSDDQSIFNPFNFSIGFGYKTAGAITILGTLNLIDVKQPRQWFIDKYGNGNLNYVIPATNGTTTTTASQQTFDTSDNSIFRNKLVLSIGFKVCFSFDVVKAYSTAASQH